MSETHAAAHPTILGSAAGRLRGVTPMTRWRILLGVAGLALGLFGVYRLLTQIENEYLTALAGWLIGAVIIHDGILSPLIVLIGVALSRIPARARRFVQGGLIVGGLMTSVGILFVVNVNTGLLQHKIGDSTKNAKTSDGPTKKVKALLEQNFALNLTIVLSIVLIVAVLLYARRVVLDSRGDGGPGTSRGRRPRPGPAPAGTGAAGTGAADTAAAAGS